MTDFSRRIGDTQRDDWPPQGESQCPGRMSTPWNFELFITDWLRKTHTVIDLCARYGISRKSGYKWIDRYLKEGPDWVLDRSHAARVIANKTPLHVEQALMQMRALHPTWGARKLLHLVGLQRPGLVLPHDSTVCDMLKRNGLITARPRRRAIGHPGRPSSVVS